MTTRQWCHLYYCSKQRQNHKEIVTLTSFCDRGRTFQAIDFSMRASTSLAGNTTLCELVIRWWEKSTWVILQLSRTITPQASWEHIGMTSAVQHNNKKKRGNQPTCRFLPNSKKLFSISLRWFSPLVYHIISGECSYNVKPQCLVWTRENWFFSPFSCQW